ncbi:MAG: methyltransferase domain-containing protein [Akkermansiaceae bacterium]|nr:methyltransferase domain-containing protein [Akkermansiaceae bacterium]
MADRNLPISRIPILRGWQRRIRKRRLEQFVDCLGVTPEERILDVGGTVFTWITPETNRLRAVLLNLTAPPLDEDLRGRLESLAGDACDLGFPDGEFDIVYSNSVIEHVGTYENQERMARELRRVGRRLWIQTPARSFFFEPHYVTPFIHWLPKRLRRRIVRWGTLWGLVKRPSRERVEEMINELRLLSFDEMKTLFPDCEIRREKLLGMTKSFIAVR